MFGLREDISARLEGAVARAEALQLWPEGLRPSSFALIDTPQREGGDLSGGEVSWPGLRTLPNASAELDQALSSCLEPSACFRLVEVRAGFANFSFTAEGWDQMLRRAKDTYAREDMRRLLRDVRRGLSEEAQRIVELARQRTLWLEKMAKDQYGLSERECDWAQELSSEEEHGLLAELERLPWVLRKGRLKLSSGRLLTLAERWNSYYEHRRLLKGTVIQIEARIALARAIRASLGED